jgi:hypothetical protein
MVRVLNYLLVIVPLAHCVVRSLCTRWIVLIDINSFNYFGESGGAEYIGTFFNCESFVKGIIHLKVVILTRLVKNRE